MADRASIDRTVEDHFESAWKDGDPWHFESSEYERQKYARQLELLSDRRYARVLEIGCAGGVFTRMLSTIADTVVGIDIAPSAIALASAREIPPGVSFRVANAMNFNVVAEGPWDLIVMSETIYYVGWLYPLFDLAWMATQLFESTAVGGRLLMADLSGGVDDYLNRPYMIRTYRDLMVNVGFERELEELFHGEKNTIRLEATITCFRRVSSLRANQGEPSFQGSLKKFTQLDHKRLGRIGRLPFDSFYKNLRTVVARAPALDETCVNVNNPILRNTLALIPLALHPAVEARRAR